LQEAKNENIQQHIITNGFENTQIQKMKSSGILHFFTHIITSEKAMSLKPEAEIFHHAMRLANTNAEESIMIGDAIDVDIAGAISVNMPAIWFNPHGMQSDLPRTYEVQHLKEIKKIIF
jgi:putative hydrolase of the HAD superfamily